MKSKSQNKILLVTIFSFLIIFIVSCNKNVDSVEEAKEYAVGIWTGSQDIYGGIIRWNKYVFNSNGSFESYGALASDDNWGDVAFSGTWETGTDKYFDTGERYYYIKLKWPGVVVSYPFVDGNLQVRYMTGGVGPILEKKDEFPFK